MWSIEQPEWKCKIDGGVAGVTWSWWSPDSRHILTMADYQLHITLWSLVDKSVSLMKHPKLRNNGVDFSPDGQFMALAESRECKDHVSIFSCSNNWELLHNFKVDTKDLNGIKWSPNGSLLCVWDSCEFYTVMVYGMDGHCFASYSPYKERYEFGLGIKTVSWSPTGQFLAIGSYDEKLRLLNSLTWSMVSDHTHNNIIEDKSVTMYVEEEQRHGSAHSTSSAANQLYPLQSKYEVRDIPLQLTKLTPDPSKPEPRLGVGKLLFSSDGRYIATRDDNIPHVVWIWDVKVLGLHVVLVNQLPIIDLKWDPRQPRLAVCCNNSRLYLWSPGGCVIANVPSDPPMNITQVSWDPSGGRVLLSSSVHFCWCEI